MNKQIDLGKLFIVMTDANGDWFVLQDGEMIPLEESELIPINIETSPKTK
jgi:hypothetical protein